PGNSLPFAVVWAALVLDLLACDALALARLAFFLVVRRPPAPTLFPYTTLFRSCHSSSRWRFCSPWSLRFAFMRWPSPMLSGFLADRKSTRLNSSHLVISYAVFCLKKKNLQDWARQAYDDGTARSGTCRQHDDVA